MSLLFSDNFNRADSSALGANWTELDAAWAIVSNQVQANANTGSTPWVIVTTTAAHAAVADMSVSVVGIRGAGFDGGPIGRQTSSGVFYAADIFGTTAELYYHSALGTSTLIATATVGAHTANDTYTLEIQGTALRVYRNGSLLVSGTHSTITAAGQAGIYSWSSSGVNLFDDFSVSDFVAATIEQEGFRFRNDDGNETSATWAAAQDTNLTAPLTTNLRLRALLNTVGDLGSSAFQIEAKKSSDSVYWKIGINAAATLSYGAIGTEAYSAASGTTVAPSYPSGITTKSSLLLIIGQKPTTASGGTVTTPTGWTLVGSSLAKGGYGATLGADTGNTSLFVYSKDAVAGTETGTLSVTVGDNNVCWGVILRHESTVDSTFAYAIATGEDTSAGNVSITFGSDPGTASGDEIIAAMCIPTDVTTPAQFSAEALSQTGITFGSVTERLEADSTTGNDIGGFICTASATAGTSSAAPTLTATAGGTTTNVRGPGVFVRIRATAVVRPIVLNPSSNFSDGSVTTAQLTAPSGKTTSNFSAGSINETSNPTAALDLAADKYTELEWCLSAVSGTAANTDVYTFRITISGTALTTYTVTPQWTIGTASGSPYTLTASAGSFALTGKASNLLRGLKVVSVAGSYSLAGIAALLKVGKLLSSITGTYVFTGKASNLLRSSLLLSNSATYTLSGQSAILGRRFTLTSNTGNYILSGQASSLKEGHLLLALTATYSLTGRSANLLRSYPLTSNAGNYTFTGKTANLLAAHKLVSDTGTYNLTGKDSNLLSTRTLQSNTGIYNLSGQVVLLKETHLLTGNTGNYSLNANSAGLYYSGSGLILTAVKGFYNLSGQASNLYKGYRLLSNTGTYNLSGQPSILVYSGSTRILIANTSSYNLVGKAVNTLIGRRLLSGSGTFALIGQNSILNYSGITKTLIASAGNSSLSGKTATLAYSGTNKVITSVTGVFNLSGQAATFQRFQGIRAQNTNYNLTGQSTSLKTTRFLTAGSATFNFTGNNSSLLRGRYVAAGSAIYNSSFQSIDLIKSTTLISLKATYNISSPGAILNYGSSIIVTDLINNDRINSGLVMAV